MNYQEGVRFMQDLVRPVREEEYYSHTYAIDGIPYIIKYPTKKKLGETKLGDYLLSHAETGISPPHVNVAQMIIEYVNDNNRLQVIRDLDLIYQDGSQANTTCIPDEMKKLIFWVTLQEDINYPPTDGLLGRKLPFQRYYEAILSTVNNGQIISWNDVESRTNNHGSGIPNLISSDVIWEQNICIPSFYVR